MSNGYVIYPGSIGKMDLEAAKILAASESKLSQNGYYSRVENLDTEATVAEFRNGQEVE